MSKSKFDECSEFVSHYLAEAERSSRYVMKPQIVEPDTYYFMCQQYMEGYIAGKGECMKTLTALMDRISELEAQVNSK